MSEVAGERVRQVGGTHYGPTHQLHHWDGCEQYDVGYLEATATKYVQRWRVAGKPRVDLGKSISYLDRLLLERRDTRRKVPGDVCLDLCRAGGLQPEDVRVMAKVLVNGSHTALTEARELLRRMLADLPEDEA